MSHSGTFRETILICSIEGLIFGSKDYTKEVKAVECTSLQRYVRDNFSLPVNCR